MNQKIKNSCVSVFSAALLSASMLNAQDTVTMRKTTIDTVTVKKTTVVHDTVAVAKAHDDRTLYRDRKSVV